MTADEDTAMHFRGHGLESTITRLENIIEIDLYNRLNLPLYLKLVGFRIKSTRKEETGIGEIRFRGNTVIQPSETTKLVVTLEQPYTDYDKKAKIKLNFGYDPSYIITINPH